MSSGGREQRKNIFLTTLGVSKDRLDIDYFVCDNAAGTLSYTTGISVAEAGIKYMLSQHRIDEIIVLGSPRGAEESESGKVSIESADIRNISSLDAMSEYGFLRYRIAEFLHRTDFEILDISELLSDSERSSLKEKIRAFRSSHRVVMGLKDLFSQLCSDAALAEAFEAEVLSGCTKEEKKWVKHYLFSQMDSFLKMHMRDENREVSIRYLPTVSDGMISIESITKVVTETLSESGGEINLYMDIQGIGATDGNTLISTFLLLSRRIGFGCRVRGLISSSRMSDAFSGTVRNALQSYEIQQLITGIDLFLEYGKDKKLRE